MPVVMIANPKGGVGKSTISTNIAGYFANKGHSVMLGDVDKQQSSKMWLEIRPATAAKIQSWEVKADNLLRAPKGITHVVLDTPAGFHGDNMKSALKLAQKVLIPVQPSIFDIDATKEFIYKIIDMKSTRGCEIALIGNRASERTLSAAKLWQFFDEMNLPNLGLLRATQNYVQLASTGLTIFDMPPSKVAKDLEQWEELCSWLER